MNQLPNGDKYEGNIINGKGKFYFKNGDRYEGDFLRDMIHGKGIFYYKNGDRYEGDFRRNIRYGKGILYYNNGDRYEGDFNGSMRHGILYYKNGDRYEGYFSDGLKWNGKYYYKNGDRYEGDFLRDMRHGKGILYYNNGDRYEGDFLNSLRDGKGILYYNNGDRYEGEFFRDMRHGKGIFTFSDGRTLEGLWERDSFVKNQTIFYQNKLSLSRYVDRYEDDLKNRTIKDGKVILYYNNGDRYKGEFFKNMRHGKGIFTFSDGRTLDGLWESDSFVKNQTIYQNKLPLSRYVVNQQKSKTCWIYAYLRIIMNLIKKYVVFSENTCPEYTNSFLTTFFDNPALYKTLPCSEAAKREFILFCYFYYILIKNNKIINNQTLAIHNLVNSLFNKRESYHFLNKELTILKDEVMSEFFKKINPTSYFFIKKIDPHQLTNILDQGLYIYIGIDYSLFRSAPKGEEEMVQYFLDKTTSTSTHAMVIREYRYSEKLKQPVFIMVNSHGLRNQFFYVPFTFLLKNTDNIQLRYLSHIYLEENTICPNGKEPHPRYETNPKKCLMKCKPGQERNVETMKCVKNKQKSSTKVKKSSTKVKKASPKVKKASPKVKKSSPKSSPKASPKVSPKASPKKRQLCTCKGIIKSGLRKGEQCGKPCKQGEYCGFHKN
jgi:hypothetical protein